MDNKEQQYLEALNAELESEKLRRMNAENQYSQMSNFQQDKQANIIEYQLDLKEELDRIHHLLSGHIITRDSEGNEVWAEPDDDRLKILSDYGVKQIMNIISFYINRNTLLSNYKEEIINWKVRDFGIELADLMFNRYEVFFHYPTPEELYEKTLKIIQDNPDSFPHLLIESEDGNITIDAERLYSKCLVWSKEELQSKLRHFPMIVLSLIDTIHSTYLRALNAEERRSLRQMTYISQTSSINGQSNPISRPGFSLMRPFSSGAK